MLNIFKRKNPTEIIEAVKIDGHTFRVLDPIKMSNERRVRFFWEDYVREWGMTKEDILSYLQFMMKETAFPKAGNLSELNAELSDKLRNVYALLATMEAVLKEDYQYKPFIKSACIIIVMDDEDPNKIDPVYHKKKLDLCQSNHKIEAFFLRTIRTLQLSSEERADMSKISEWYPSEKLKIMESSIYKKINSTIYEIGE